MNNQLWWFTARAGGLVSWALLSASVLWGLALSGRAIKGLPRPNWVLDLHRFIGGLSVVFTAVHVLALIADSYTHFGLTEVLVPFTGSWHPAAVAAGVVSMYLLLAVELTSLARKRLSKRLWRATHLASFPLFALGTVHLLTAGTDRNNVVLQVAVIAVIAAVVGLTGHRVASARQQAAEKAARPARIPQRTVPTPSVATFRSAPASPAAPRSGAASPHLPAPMPARPEQRVPVGPRGS